MTACVLQEGCPYLDTCVDECQLARERKEREFLDSRESTPKPAVIDRQNTHGDYASGAVMTQKLMRILQQGESWDNLTDVHIETLHMLCHKMVRMVHGNPFDADHTKDIAGYATRLVEYLEKSHGP